MFGNSTLGNLVRLAITTSLVLLLGASVAQAEIKENGATLEGGAGVTATSSNFKITLNGSNYLACTKVTILGVLGANLPNYALLEKVEVTTENCSLNSAQAALITNPTLGDIGFASGTGEAKATFEYDIPGLKIKDCHLEAAAVFFQYEGGNSLVTLNPSVLQGKGPTGCVAKATIEGDFALETADGAGLIIE